MISCVQWKLGHDWLCSVETGSCSIVFSGNWVMINCVQWKLGHDWLCSVETES
jgi:hypothetical protein